MIRIQREVQQPSRLTPLRKSNTEDSKTATQRVKTSCQTDRPTENTHLAADMYGIAGMPDLLPPTGSLQPSIMVLGNQRNGPSDALHNPPQRIVQRAPKLGQIGRSKRGRKRDFLKEISCDT